LKRFFYISILLLFCSPDISLATTYYSRANGNSNVASTWSFTGHTGAAATNAPFQTGDVLYINHTITGNGSLSFTTLNIDGTSGVLIINSGVTWTVSGSFNNSNNSTTTSWWGAASAGTLDIDGNSSNTATFYANTTIASGGKIICPKFTVNSLKTLTINAGGTLETTYSSGINTVTGTIFNAGTLISGGNLTGTGTLYNHNSGGTSGGLIRLKKDIAVKVIAGTIANNITIEGGTSHNFMSGNDLSQTTITIGSGTYVSFTFYVTTNPIKVKKITFNNCSSPSNLYLNTADVTVYNLDGGDASGADGYVSINSGRTLTIEGSVTDFAPSSGFFRGSTGSTVYFASGLDSYAGWTKVDQIVPTVETAGAYAVSYPGNLKIRTDGNTVKIGSNIESDGCYNDLFIYGNLEIFATTNGGTVTTDKTYWSASSYYIKLGSSTASTPGTLYFTRDASGSYVNPLTLNVHHRIEKNNGGTYPATVYMGNAASTINVYYENATYPAINYFTKDYTTLITSLSPFYGVVNYLGTATGTNQIAIPVSYFDMTVNRTNSAHVVQLKNYSIAVRNDLTMTQGLVDVNDLNIDLLTTGEIIDESNTNRIFCSGCASSFAEGRILSQGTDLAAANDYSNIRGMGIGINTGANAPGITDINRGFRIRSGGELNTSVKRYFEITPTNNTSLAATLTFHYWDLESNGLSISEVALYRDNTGSDAWVKRGGSYAAPVPGDNTVTLPDIEQFSPWTVGKNNEPVPVRLLFFDATCDNYKILLNWSTASETNCDNFIIEKSYDTKTWANIGSLAGAGNSNHLINYSFSDDNPFEGTMYYRLKQVDYDGSSNLYGPVAAGCSENSNNLEIQVYPNPTAEKVYVQAAMEAPGSILLCDILGRTIAEYQQNNLSVPFEVSMEGVPSGIYMIRVVTEGFSKNYKIVRK